MPQATSQLTEEGWKEKSESCTIATSPDLMTDQTVELDERAQSWYQLAMSVRYGFSAKPIPAQGSCHHDLTAMTKCELPTIAVDARAADVCRSGRRETQPVELMAAR